MALSTIVAPDGEPQNMIIDVNRGDIGTVQGLNTESNSSNGAMMVQIPVVVGGGSGEISYPFG